MCSCHTYTSISVRRSPKREAEKQETLAFYMAMGVAQASPERLAEAVKGSTSISVLLHPTATGHTNAKDPGYRNPGTTVERD